MKCVILLWFISSVPFVVPAHRGNYKGDFPEQKNYLNVISKKDFEKFEKSLSKRKLLEIHKTDTFIVYDTLTFVDTFYVQLLDTLYYGFKGVQVLTYDLNKVIPKEQIEILGDTAFIFSSTCNLGTDRWNSVLVQKRADYLDSLLTTRGVKLGSKSTQIKLGRFSIVLWR